MKNWGQIYVGKELLEKVEKITDCDYEINGDLVDPYRLVEMVYDLQKKYEDTIYSFDEKIEELKDMKTEDIDYEYESWRDTQWEN